MKLRRIAINKFHRFKYVEIHFDRITSINGKIISQDGLKFLSEAIKFVLDCCELAPQKLLYTTAGSHGTIDDKSGTSVEADIIFPDETQKKFIKRIVDDEVLYEVNEMVVTQQMYVEELLSSGILTLPLNTLSIGPGSVNKVSTLTEFKRAAFIELFSGSEGIIKKYADLSAILESTKIELDASLKYRLGLANEKKKVKTQKESSNKRAQLIHEKEMKTKELELFCVYHNSKFFQSAYDVTLTRELHLEDLKDSLTVNLQGFRENATEETSRHHQKILAEAKLELAFEEFKTSCRDMNWKSASPQALQHDLQASIAFSNARTADARQQVERLAFLGENTENLNQIRQEFQQLQASFDDSNAMEQFNVLNMDRIAHNFKIELLESSIVKNQASAESNAKEISSIEQKLQGACKRRQEKRLARDFIDAKQDEADELMRQLDKLQNEAAYKDEKSSTESRQKVVGELKNKFPARVIGRISELHEPIPGVSEKFTRGRLGKLADAIVVDATDTAEACVAHLKAKQLSIIDETFIPLDALGKKQKTSKDYLLDGKLPEAVDCVFIEDLVQMPEEHKQVFSYCAKPCLVTSTHSDAETLLRLPESKKLDVVSMNTSTCFRKQGFTEVTGEEDESINLHETIVKAETKLVMLRAELDLLIPRRTLLNREISILDALIERIEKSMEPYRELYLFHINEVRAFEDEKNQIFVKVDKGKTKLFNELKSKFEVKKSNHFSLFCKELKIPGIDGYLRTQEPSQELVEIKFEMLGRNVSTCEGDEAFVRDVAAQITSMDISADDSFEEVNRMDQNLKTKERELARAVEEFCSHIKSFFEMSKDIEQQKQISNELTIQIHDIYEQIYDNLSRVQMSIKENYQIINDNFVNHSTLALQAGSIGNFIVPPDNVPANFHLVSAQLKTIEVKFDHLKSSLKGVDNVEAKTRSMMKTLEALDETIKKCTGKVSETVSIQRFERITEDLKEAIKIHETFQKKMAELNEKMQFVKEERKKMFEESLDALNEGVSEFCKLAFNQQNVAYLKATNEVEPYLGEVAYFWSSLENVDNRVSELIPDPVAALALLFAILKFKQQKFVILEDALKNIVNVASMEKFMRQQNFLQIVSLTSQITDESSNYMIREKSQSFVVTRFN